MSMQRKGEQESMTGKEYCRYIRSYSELEGLQRAHTLLYCAATVPQGVLAEVRWEQRGFVRRSRVLTPPGSFARVMQLLRYLCENSIGLEQWLDVLDDARQPYQRLEEDEDADVLQGMAEKNIAFCGIC